MTPDNLTETQKVFQEIFGVDDQSLSQVSLSMGKPDTHYKTSIESQEIQGYQQDGWPLAWLHRPVTQFFSTGLDYVPTCCFYSHHRRYTQQKGVLDETAGKTKNVLWKILKDSISQKDLDN